MIWFSWLPQYLYILTSSLLTSFYFILSPLKCLAGYNGFVVIMYDVHRQYAVVLFQFLTQMVRAVILLQNKITCIPYAVVQEALGHEDPESAKYYVRVDIRRLRMCALDVPKPTGAFAVMLGDLEGVL